MLLFPLLFLFLNFLGIEEVASAVVHQPPASLPLGLLLVLLCRLLFFALALCCAVFFLLRCFLLRDELEHLVDDGHFGFFDQSLVRFDAVGYGFREGLGYGYCSLEREVDGFSEDLQALPEVGVLKLLSHIEAKEFGRRYEIINWCFLGKIRKKLPSVILEESLEGVLTPDVRDVLDAQLVELNSLRAHAVDHQPSRNINQYLLLLRHI